MQRAGLHEAVDKVNSNEISLHEVVVSPASELLSLMAAPEFKKYKDQLGDFIEDADFAKIDKLYTALYAELKKHE